MNKKQITEKWFEKNSLHPWIYALSERAQPGHGMMTNYALKQPHEALCNLAHTGYSGCEDS